MNYTIESLINQLGYSSENLVESNDKYYDYYYRIKISLADKKEESICNIIGIKVFNSIDEDEISKYHRIYWNKNDLPVSILVFKDEIRIYNNFVCDKEKALLYSSKNTAQTKFKLDYLSNDSILSNKFWNKLSGVIKNSERVDVKLLNNLEATINVINKNSNCNKNDAFDFITKCILIKYLEDREILVNSTFSQFDSENFIGVLSHTKSDKILSFFNHLKKRFNSDFFEVSSNEVFRCEKALTQIIEFFKGTDVESGQLSLFPYDFSIIPIQLISSIYEKFFNLATTDISQQKARKESGSFYTPYFLSDFIVNREIILTKDNYKNIKIMDPACGSGVFLVSAFKRIVEFYKSNQVDINAKVLNDIILNQLFGIDKNVQALKITEFSLYIALLDCMNPKDLEVNKFEFPILVGKTLHGESFFSPNCIEHGLLFDIIIGNPPWRGIGGDHVNYCQQMGYELSDKQLAQAFVYRANDFIKPSGNICFILPNSIFCNTNPIGFRKQILKIMTIEELLNLSSISNKLFADAAFPCSIVKISKFRDNSKTKVANFTPNVFSNILNKIVFDFNSSYTVDSKLFSTYDYLWNIIMDGDYYDFLLVQKFLAVNNTIKNLCDEYGLRTSQGYSKAKGTRKYDSYEGYDILDDQMAHSYIFKNRLSKHTGSLAAERIHDEEQYKEHKKVVFRRTLKSNSKTNYAAFYNDKLLYNNKYYCIFDPNDCVDETLFYYLEAVLNSKVYTYFQFHMSTGFKLNPPEIRKDKALDFPIIKYNENSEIIQQISSNSKQIKKLYSQIENSELFSCSYEEEEIISNLEQDNEQLLYKLYDLDNEDIETINYTINCRIPNVRNRQVSIVTKTELTDYCNTIKNYFDELVSKTNKKLNCIAYYSSTAVAIKLSFSEEDSEPIISSGNGSILLNDYSNNLLVVKKLKIYSDDSFGFIKTSDSYNWQKHNAFIDFQDIIQDSFEMKEGQS